MKYLTCSLIKSVMTLFVQREWIMIRYCNFVILLFIVNISAASSVNANSLININIVEKQRFLRSDGKGTYEVIGTIAKEWDDPGEYTQLIIRTPDGKELALTDLAGVPIKDNIPISTPNLLNSRYLLLIPKAPRDKNPFLVFTEWAYGSTPGYVTVIALNDNGYPEVVFREELVVTEFVDYDGDGYLDILINGYSGGGEPRTRDLVYTQKDINGHIKFKVNDNLSRKWSNENRPHSPAAGQASVDKTKKLATSNPLEPLIQYQVDHTYSNVIRLALVDNYDNLERLRRLDKRGLNIVKNAIYARRGYVFERQDLREYFEEQDWYKKQAKLSSEQAVELDGVDKATLEIIKIIATKPDSQILEQLQAILSIEKRSDTPWKEENFTLIPPVAGPTTSLGGVHIGDEFNLNNLEKRFGQAIWKYQAMHQEGEFGGRNRGFTANLYLFNGIGVRTQNDGHGERIYAIQSTSSAYKTSSGVAVGTKMSAFQASTPWMWIENQSKGLVSFDGCDNYSISYEQGVVNSVLLRGCDRYRDQ